MIIFYQCRTTHKGYYYESAASHRIRYSTFKKSRHNSRNYKDYALFSVHRRLYTTTDFFSVCYRVYDTNKNAPVRFLRFQHTFVIQIYRLVRPMQPEQLKNSSVVRCIIITTKSCVEYLFRQIAIAFKLLNTIKKSSISYVFRISYGNLRSTRVFILMYNGFFFNFSKIR